MLCSLENRMPPLASPQDWFGDFGVDEALIQKALSTASAHGADDADLYFEHTTSTSVALSDKKVNRVHTSTVLGVGIRVVIGDQVGYTFTENLSLKSVLSAARTASEIARGGKAVQPQNCSPIIVPNHYPVDRLWADVDVGARVPLVRKWESWAFDADPRVQRVQVQLSDADKRVLIACLDGRRAFDYRPMTGGYVSCTSVEGDKREAGGYNVSARSGLEYYSEERQRRLVSEAVKRSTQALSAKSPEAGEMTVVMAPGSSGILLHEAIGHGLEADFNRKKISIFADKMGQSVAKDEVTICDDATIPGARGALNIDDEGNQTENTTLIENGVLRSYLHDSISARHYGATPTGSGRRQSFRHPVIPRMRCTYMQSGPHDPGEIIKSVKKGLYCETFSNGQVAIGAGNFAFYVRHGYLIEDGKLTQPVKDVNLIGNGPEVLAAIEMVGNDLEIDEGGWTCGKEGQGVPVSQGMPTVKVSKLSVGGGRQ
jgi:TldD protein